MGQNAVDDHEVGIITNEVDTIIKEVDNNKEEEEEKEDKTDREEEDNNNKEDNGIKE